VTLFTNLVKILIKTGDKTMSSDTKADQFLIALSKEVVKIFRVYDGSDRLITTYETFANSRDGAVALKTEYAYVGATTKLEKMKESLSVWSAAYEI
jgi:hypothetical protein